MTPWQYVAVAGLGAFHGLSPGMGWMVCLAAGLHQRSRSALLRALGPVITGHALSVLVAAMLVSVIQSVTTTRLVAIGGGVLLVGFGAWHALRAPRGHALPRRPSGPHLLVWSFLMSSIHGAGLALLPVLTAVPAETSHDHHHGAALAGAQATLWQGLAATVVHTAAMAVVVGVIALLAYQILGLSMVRLTSWLDLDKVWALALAGSGIATVLLAVV